MKEEIENLQTQVAFQEHTIAELNEALTDQQKQLDRFRLEFRLLQEKLADLESQLDSKPLRPDDEVPPHY